MFIEDKYHNRLINVKDAKEIYATGNCIGIDFGKETDISIRYDSTAERDVVYKRFIHGFEGEK